MNFKQEYIAECFRAFQFNSRWEFMEKALKENNPLVFRYQIEDTIEELELQLKPQIIPDYGELMVWNSKVNYWLTANKLYSEFMEEYMTELDQELIQANTEIQELKT